MIEIPIVGKWYVVIEGPNKGFIGECLAYNDGEILPAILQDLFFNTVAVKPTEVQATLRQPSIPDVQQERKN